ncbi:MAG: SUF system NifU family Fe-S cluster assembly protein [Candidatus Omnitrophica bacterium]|nr:SUF system NifU family Fe-S cluster assembly protein [Candidatus Omnitrophota bacterium]
MNSAPEPKLGHLYQEVILDHNRRPRNFKEIPGATQYSHGKNPLCGDDYHLYLVTSPQGKIQDVGFQGAGCAISKSSASMMTSLIKDKSVSEAARLKDYFLDFMTKDPVTSEVKTGVGKLTLFEGVKEFPVRVKCATLIWHALQDALKDVKSPV